MKQPYHICLVGGEDAYKRIDLAHELIQKGFKVTILGTMDHDYPDDIGFIKYGLNRKLNLIADIRTIAAYRKIVKANNFDIMQTFDTKPAFLVPLALFGINIIVVRTITGLGKVFSTKGVRSWPSKLAYIILHRLAKPNVDHTTFQNTDDRDIYLKYGLVDDNNHSMIYGSGINLKEIQSHASRKRNPFTAICVSRLIYEKGIINYLEAAKICADKGHNFKFILVGPLEEQSNKLNHDILEAYAPYVSWLGTRSDVMSLLLSADVFVLPTFYREGFARVLLEASAVGLPLITTDVPGVRDIARHNTEGLIVAQEDSQNLAAALIKLGTDEELSNTLAANSLNRVKEFSLENISNQYALLYNKLL